MKPPRLGSSSRSIALLVLAGAVASWICAGAAVATAQRNPPPQPGKPENAAAGPSLEGNWIIEWHNYPEGGQTTRLYAVLKRQWEMTSVEEEGGGNRYYNVASQADGSWTLNYTSDLENWGGTYPQVDERGSLEYEWGDFAGRRSTLRATGPNAMSGSWSTPHENPEDRKTGAEVWRRVTPRISRIVFKGVSHYEYAPDFAPYDDPAAQTESVATPGGKPGRVEGTYGSGRGWSAGNDMRGNRPKFKVEIYGENLWGHHLIDVGGALDLEPLPEWRTFILEDGSTHTAPSNPTRVAGIVADVVIWPEARPGEKELWVDGVAYPFELVFHGFPGAPVSERRPSAAGTTAEGSMPSEVVPLILAGAVAGLALASLVGRRRDPPARADDLRADVDKAKAEFERLQQALRERVNRELSDVRAFDREFDETWAEAMRALDDYIRRYPQLLPGLTALTEQLSSREFALEAAKWADTALAAATLGHGVARIGLGTARRAGGKAVREAADDAMVGARAERPRRPRGVPKSKGGPPAVESPVARAIREATEKTAAEERVLKKARRVNSKAEELDLGENNCVSAACATDQRLAGELSENVWPKVLPDGPQALPSVRGVNPMDIKELLMTRVSRMRGMPTEIKGVAKGNAGRIQIEEAMKQAGENARGIVVMRRRYTVVVDGQLRTQIGNHALNVVNEKGRIIFVDGQSEQIYRAWSAVEDLAWIRTN